MHRARVIHVENAKIKNNRGIRERQRAATCDTWNARRNAFREGLRCTYTFISRGDARRRFTLFTSPLQPLKLHVARHGERRFIFHCTHPGDSPSCRLYRRTLVATFSPRPCKHHSFPGSAILNYSFSFLFDKRKSSATLETDDISRACWLKRANIVFSTEIYYCYNVSIVGNVLLYSVECLMRSNA